MPLSPVPITALPQATLPLNGSEIVPLVKSGVTSQAPLSAVSAAMLFGPEYSIALAAGVNNNVPLAGNRALLSTAAGDATVTGFDATNAASGAPLMVTNTGVNLLILAAENAGSLAANRIYCNTDIALLSGQSALQVRSGTLLRWVLIA